jgi:hypothetical protein
MPYGAESLILWEMERVITRPRASHRLSFQMKKLRPGLKQIRAAHPLTDCCLASEGRTSPRASRLCLTNAFRTLPNGTLTGEFGGVARQKFFQLATHQLRIVKRKGSYRRLIDCNDDLDAYVHA